MRRLQLIIMMLLALPIGMLAQGSTWQEAIAINQGETGSYSLDKNKTEAWFKIEVPEEGRVVITQTLSDNLEMRWVEVCRSNGDQTPVGRTSMWWMKNNESLEVTDIGKGTYYLHVSREGGAGTCTLKYDFTPCPRANDAEPNDNVGEGDEIAAGQTVEGRIGYLDANDYRDNDDCYKIVVPQDGRIQLITTCQKDYDLEFRWMEVCYQKEDQTYPSRTSKWWMVNDTLTIEDAGVGTYYVHLNREKGHGGYALTYIFTPNKYANDAEQNDNVGEGDELVNGQTIEGHIGYLDANDYRDNDDCYKIVVPQDGRIQLITTCQKDYDLEFRWMEVCYQKEDQTYPSRTSKWWIVNDTLTIEDAGVGTYYVHLNREKGHGGYALTYIFTPNEYANDAEPNDNVGEGDEIAIGQTVQGHIGYLDANDYRDNDDCYKIVVPQDGRVQLVTSCQKDYDLQFRWMEVCYLKKEDQTYPSRTSKWWMVNDTLTIEDAGAGTYYLHLNREKGHGGYTLKYLHTPNNFPNDAEPNEEMEQVTQVIDISETMTGHLGYLDDNDKRDNEDWIKLNTSAAAAMMAVTIEPDTTSTLRLRWADIVRVKGDKSDVVANQWWINERTTLTVNDIDDADYYIHICREQGQGGYSISYNAIERAADSDVRIAFIGQNSVRLGVPSEYTVKLENIENQPTGKFFLLVHASDDIKLLGCKLPGLNGVEELPMDSISYDGDKSMVFLVPSMNPYEEYSFNILAEGLTMNEARSFDRDVAGGRQKIVISGTTFLIVTALVAIDYAGDKVTEFMTDVINEHIDLDEKELAYYREHVNHKVDQQLATYKKDTGEGVVVAKRAIKTVATSWMSTLPGGGVINFFGELLETAKTFSGAITRRWMWWTTKETDANYKEWEKKYNTRMLDAKYGCNRVVRSWDPNEMVGPVGFGDENYIPETRTMDYRILFENKKEATAPAYRVQITNELDENVFDINSVRFGSTSHEGIEYNWKMSREGNKLTWDIKGIELPPNVNAPEGEGYVTFSVNLKPGLKNGTQIKNKATIIFDVNEPIETNEYINTLDLNGPTTEMVSAGEKDGSMIIKCTGTDNESGISYFRYYASYKDGDFVYIGDDTSSEFTYPLPSGTTAADYKFYALAVDNVGNTQKTAPAPIDYTGIREITYQALDGSGWTVYTLKGVRVAHGDGPMQLALPAGIYVIRNGKSARKVIIK